MSIVRMSCALSKEKVRQAGEVWLWVGAGADRQPHLALLPPAAAMALPQRPLQTTHSLVTMLLCTLYVSLSMP